MLRMRYDEVPIGTLNDPSLTEIVSPSLIHCTTSVRSMSNQCCFQIHLMVSGCDTNNWEIDVVTVVGVVGGLFPLCPVVWY
jgi:hypothetical protein